MKGKGRENELSLKRIGNHILNSLVMMGVLLFGISLIGMNVDSIAADEVMLAAVLILPAFSAGYRIAKECSIKAMQAGVIPAVIILLTLSVAALLIFRKVPHLKDCAKTGAMLLAGSELGAMIGERKRPKRRR